MCEPIARTNDFSTILARNNVFRALCAAQICPYPLSHRIVIGSLRRLVRARFGGI